MPEILAEYVNWNREDIRHTALQIVSFYTHDLRQLGTSRWVDFASRVIPVVMGEAPPNEVRLKGDAFELIFCPPKPTLSPHIQNVGVIWQEAEPRLVFHDSTFMNLAAGYRNLIYELNGAISEEVVDVYRMRVEEDPLSFIFPKDEYGEVQIARAVLIGGN